MLERRLRLLSKWRTIAAKATDIIKELYLNAEVYVFGGAAEDRLTVLSDIDIAVVLESPPEKQS